MSDQIAISCTGLSKRFRIPHDEQVTLRGRLLHPRSRATFEEFDALDDVSFEIRRGEFFGIVGRNGSGKSTLLKVLAGIYQPSGGTLEVNGSLAPFIELGVGFNMDLSGHDNVHINGAILGMSKEALDAAMPNIVEFAELDGFMQMKLRNYSSGMLMRLAFAIAVQAEADILLVDEVLAVGDERFQRKCQDVFRERRRRGQTVVFVSHDMSAVEAFCDRAIVLHHGELVAEGKVAEVVPTYHRLNRDTPEQEAKAADRERDDAADAKLGATPLVMSWPGVEPDAVARFDASAPITINAIMDLPIGTTNGRLRLIVFNEAGGAIGELLVPSSYDTASRITIDNVLTPGRYRIIGELFATREGTHHLADSAELQFDIPGDPVAGSTRFSHTIEAGVIDA